MTSSSGAGVGGEVVAVAVVVAVVVAVEVLVVGGVEVEDMFGTKLLLVARRNKVEDITEKAFMVF